MITTEMSQLSFDLCRWMCMGGEVGFVHAMRRSLSWTLWRILASNFWCAAASPGGDDNFNSIKNLMKQQFSEPSWGRCGEGEAGCGVSKQSNKQHSELDFLFFPFSFLYSQFPLLLACLLCSLCFPLLRFHLVMIPWPEFVSWPQNIY